jgi:hypothetical protein
LKLFWAICKSVPFCRAFFSFPRCCLDKKVHSKMQIRIKAAKLVCVGRCQKAELSQQLS